MKVGIIPINIGVQAGEQIVQIAQLAEGLGYESVWTFEHVIVPVDYESKYPYNDSGKMGAPPETNFVDPLIALTAVAASTSTIRLGTGVNILSQVNPIYIAKQAASLDFMSNGRFMLGVGIGWLKEEFAALGVPWEDRAGRTIECIEVMRSLWCDEVSSYDGKYYQIKAAYQNPKPVQKPHPPILFGGESDAALRRVASIGQGWYGFNLTPDTLEERLEFLSTRLEEHGRALSDIKIYAGMHPSVRGPSEMAKVEALGVEQVILGVMAGKMETLAARAQKAMAAVHG